MVYLRAILIRLLFVSCTLGITKVEIEGANWSQFRGPNAAGVTDDGKAVPVAFGKDTNLLWKLKLPSGASSPCVRGDRIFVTGFDRSMKELIVYCVNRLPTRIYTHLDPSKKPCCNGYGL